MNKRLKIIGLIALLASAAGMIRAQDANVDRVVVPLSEPSKPAIVKVDLLNGSITVKGYQGKDVIVEARPRDRAIFEKKAEEKGATGMRRLNLGTSGLTVEEKNNSVSVEVESINRGYDISLQVPVNTSLKLETTNGGDLVVDNIAGEIDANNTNGAIYLTNISGTALAETTNGEIKVTFLKVDADRPMAWSTTNGDIDITLPADTKATLRMKTEMGEVFSDFEVVTKAVQQKTEKDSRKEGGKYRITFERGIVGSINGGGPEFTFETFNGSIYVRKAK
jgi:hypothetical protein